MTEAIKQEWNTHKETISVHTQHREVGPDHFIIMDLKLLKDTVFF